MASPTSSDSGTKPKTPAWDPNSDDMPVNPSKPPPLYWGEVTIVKRGDPRRGKHGTIVKRYPQKNPDGQWVYDISFSDEWDLVQYVHDDLFMGRP